MIDATSVAALAAGVDEYPALPSRGHAGLHDHGHALTAPRLLSVSSHSEGEAVGKSALSPRARGGRLAWGRLLGSGRE
jgi:hypothetical protein